MEEWEGIERRTCKRFKVPGAVLSYKIKEVIHVKTLEEKRKYDEESCPVLSLSLGGLRFLGEKLLKNDSEIIINLSIPDESVPLIFRGRVRWLSYDAEQRKYITGVQFNPYGEKEGQNYPKNRAKIVMLEHKFSSRDES